jgi:hypothetical protein
MSSTFLLPAAVTEMVALTSELATRAWASDQTHTAYFEPPDASAPIRRLYSSDDLTEAGGHFDYYPALGTSRDDNYPGGQHALHRVTPVSGPRPRINSVLIYGEHPEMKLNELTQKLFYGRTA